MPQGTGDFVHRQGRAVVAFDQRADASCGCPVPSFGLFRDEFSVTGRALRRIATPARGFPI
jgi:hypothetical protein